MTKSELPGSADKWQQLIKKNGLGSDKTIYNYAGAKSASEIELDQYLLLRVLNKGAQPASELAKKRDSCFGSENIKNATAKLEGFPSWTAYIARLSSAQPGVHTSPTLDGMGTFSLVYYYQEQVLKKKSSNRVDSTPKLHFTRARRAITGPATPTPNERGKNSSRSAISRNEEDIASKLERQEIGSPDTPRSDLFSITPESPITKEEAAFFTAVEDEQIVNTCLLLFLQGISIHFFDKGPEWTIHRLPFQFRSRAVTDASKIFEARVDGYLRMRDGSAGAIIEVKPFVRELRADKIRMQEAAQLASWICEQPPPIKDLVPGKTFTRLLISQDRHEIYLSFAQFDYNYVAYVCNPDSTSAQLSFLEIREFGPFGLNKANSVKVLGHILLAFMMKVSS